MNRIVRIWLSPIALLVLVACNLFGTPAAVPGTPIVRLTVQTQNAVNTFSRAGEVITYQYVVTNTGTTPLAGPIIITDVGRTATCPNVNTVGNQDAYLDLNETITCTAPYTITDADFTNGTVTNSATATVGVSVSNQTGVTLTRSTATPQASSVLRLTKTASTTTYNQVGQTITYTYIITNLGTVPLGPVQFTITDNKLGAAFNCGPANTTIAASQSLNCSAPYVITQADLSSPNLTNTATATGAGHVSAPAMATITNQLLTQTPTTNITVTPAPSGNYTPGTTIQHPVDVGEWLFQIARCYGANINELIRANPQIRDPDIVLESDVVTVPSIGSMGPIYGPQCVVFHTFRTGDTWNSIAQQYNACLAVLQRVNPGGLTGSIKVPRNSARLYCPGSAPSPSVTFTPTSTGTAPAVAQRITIDPGQTTASRIGLIGPNERIQYLLSAAAGQVLTIRLTAPTNEVAIGVNGPTGLILKPLDPTPVWSATIANAGDHTITLQGVLGSSSKSYTLEISLAAATPTPTSTPTATPTATSTPG
jgi:uncharacterized repeat protein (TIGR01451 family)